MKVAMVVDPNFWVIVGGMSGAIVAMALYIKAQHSRSNTNLVKMTEALLKNSQSTERINKSFTNLTKETHRLIKEQTKRPIRNGKSK